MYICDMTYEYEEAGVYIAFTCPDLDNKFWVAMLDFCHSHISHHLVSPGLGLSRYALGVPIDYREGEYLWCA